MADFLTIDGTPWDVQSQGAGESYVRVGGERRAFDGTLRSSKKAGKLETSGFQTAPLDSTDSSTFRGLDDGTFHSIGGDVIGGTVQALVVIEGSSLIAVGDTGFLRVFRFALREG